MREERQLNREYLGKAENVLPKFYALICRLNVITRCKKSVRLL